MKNIRIKLGYFLVSLVVIAPFAVPASATLINGSFSDPLDPATNWTANGAVSLAGGQAVLGDGVSGEGSRLFQIASIAPGAYQIDFDFHAGLSSQVDLGHFADSFFASLYFVNDPSAFNVDVHQFSDSTGLFDLDHSGFLQFQGTSHPSDLDPEWINYTFSFQNNYLYVIPYFTLIDLNGVGADSQVLLDNVEVTPVPEPSTLALLVLGLSLAAVATAGRARRRRSDA